MIGIGLVNELYRIYRMSTEYLVTSGKNHKITQSGNEVRCKEGLVIVLTDVEIGKALHYYFEKATMEIKEFEAKMAYEGISNEDTDGIHAFLFIRMVFFRFNMDILNFWANIILIYS